MDKFVGHSTDAKSGVLVLRARWTGWSSAHDTMLSVLEMVDALRPKATAYCREHGLANPYVITHTNSNLAPPKGDGSRKAYCATEDELLMRLSDASHSYADMPWPAAQPQHVVQPQLRGAGRARRPDPR